MKTRKCKCGGKLSYHFTGGIDGIDCVYYICETCGQNFPIEIDSDSPF